MLEHCQRHSIPERFQAQHLGARRAPQEDRQPLGLTINGKAEVVVQDAEAYQEPLERVETIKGIQRGLADVKAGRTKPAREVFNRFRRKHGVPR